MKIIPVDDSFHETVKKASEKSGVGIRSLVELLITMNVNFLNDPIKIAEKRKMYAEGNRDTKMSSKSR